MCKNILALFRYRDLRVGIFYFASPCINLIRNVIYYTVFGVTILYTVYTVYCVLDR